MLVDGGELLAFTSFPKEAWTQIWPNHPAERLNKEIRRRTDAVGIFPNHVAYAGVTGPIADEVAGSGLTAVRPGTSGSAPQPTHERG